MQTLLKRVLPGERLELRHELARTPQCELGVEPIHADSQPQLLETPDLGLREVEQPHLLQRRATPQPERLGERGARALALTRRAESAAFLGEPLEAQAVQLLRIDVHEIAARASLEDPVTQTAPQPRDRHLKRIRRVRAASRNNSSTIHSLGTTWFGRSNNSASRARRRSPPRSSRLSLADDLERTENVELGMRHDDDYPPIPEWLSAARQDAESTP